VLIDPLVLRTLDTRELRSGLAEVIKYSIINDQEFFSYLQTNIDKALQLDQSVLPAIIKTCCTIKAAITSQDEREGEFAPFLTSVTPLDTRLRRSRITANTGMERPCQ